VRPKPSLAKGLFLAFKNPDLWPIELIMLEQFIAPSDYELAQLLAETIDPREFPQEGVQHFKFKTIRPGVFEPVLDAKIYHDDMEFMREVSGRCPHFAFVCNRNGETILGYSAPKMMAEFIRIDSKWILREYEDFKTRPQSPAEMRFEVSKDYEALKKFLS